VTDHSSNSGSERGEPQYGAILGLPVRANADLPLTGAPADADHEPFVDFLTALSNAFVDLAPSRFDEVVEHWLGRVAQQFGLDRSSVGEIDDGDKLMATHTYARPGIAPQPKHVVNGYLPWYCDQLCHGRPVCLNDAAEDLPGDAALERAYVAAVGMKSNLSFPLEVGGNRVGVLAMSTFAALRTWTPEDHQLLAWIALRRRARRESPLHLKRQQGETRPAVCHVAGRR
jgi:hypothetical protein